jgi:hypothetical protein
MAYLINKSDGTALVTIEDGVLDTSTSVGLLGRNYTGYGEIQNENFVFLLENFSNSNPPSRPMRGQSWYDSSNNRMNVYTGTEWAPISSATISESPPPAVMGALWLRTSSNQLSIFNGNVWTVIGPEAVEGFGETKAMSSVLKDTNNIDHAVILMKINGQVQGIWSSESFSINNNNAIDGFFELLRGLNLSGFSAIRGNLIGNVSTANRLTTGRTINGVNFDGSSNVSITASTTNSLIRGTYLTGSDFNGSSSTTWNVDASSSNSIGTIVARDSNGSFDANTITASNFIGTLSGNVNVTTGTSGFNNIVANEVDGKIFTGRSARASRLDVGRTINNVVFDGSQNIVVSANAETLTGTFIKDTVLTSNLERVGTLSSLSILDQGLAIGTGNNIQIALESNIPTIRASGKINLILSNDGPSLSFVTPNESLSQGGPIAPAILSNNLINLGIPTKKFNNVYANNFIGNASSASVLLNSRTINGIEFNGSQNIVVLDNTKLPLTGGTVTGSLVANVVETIFNVGNTGTSLTLNWNNGTIQTVTANNNFTLALPVNMPSGSSITAIITQDSSGNRRLTASSGYIFASGYKTLSTQPNTVDLLNIFKAGSVHFVTLTTGYA